MHRAHAAYANFAESDRDLIVRFSTTNFANWSEIVFNFEPTPQIVVGSLLKT